MINDGMNIDIVFLLLEIACIHLQNSSLSLSYQSDHFFWDFDGAFAAPAAAAPSFAAAFRAIFS